LIHLIQAATIGRGATTVAFAPYWKQDTISNWINHAWNTLPLDEWRHMCRPILNGKRSRSESSDVFSISSSSRWPVIVKLSETQPILDKTGTLILWKHDLPFANRRSAKPHPLLEVITYSLIQRVIAPLHPSVCSFSYCFPAPVLPQTMHKLSMIKVEEYISGTSLSRLFRDASFAAIRSALTLRDVFSMIGQSIAL
jgi:hypothetical protein